MPSDKQSNQKAAQQSNQKSSSTRRNQECCEQSRSSFFHIPSLEERERRDGEYQSNPSCCTLM